LFTGSVQLKDYSLFRLFTVFDAYLALVQFRGAMRTTKIPATAVARHEGHPDSVFGFAFITLAGTAGFGHCDISITGRLNSVHIIDILPDRGLAKE
jgi:hypothetical protein